MSRHDDQRLTDILASAEAVAGHLRRGGSTTGWSMTRSVFA
jgi:hypothetical protein